MSSQQGCERVGTGRRDGRSVPLPNVRAMRKCAVQRHQPSRLTATDGGAMLADCDRCALRDIACPECVITVIEDGPARLSPEEVRALRVLADAGLVPPLRFSPTQTAGPAAAPRAVPVPVPAAAPLPVAAAAPRGVPVPVP